MISMSRYGSSFREPPWVMGDPSEVMDWMDATHPTKKEKVDMKPKYLKNLHIRFDLDVAQTPIESEHFLANITGKKYVEEDFDMLFITDVILRGLAKAKFKEIEQITLDNKLLFKEQDSEKNIRGLIDFLKDYKKEISQGKKLDLIARITEYGKATADIHINKIHQLNEHSIHIEIKGEILQFVYHSFVNYLHEKIGFLKEETPQQ